MSLYEHVVITRPDISTTQVEEFVQNLATKIENMGILGTKKFYKPFMFMEHNSFR